jgi:radical SAM family uncharacterized protein
MTSTRIPVPPLPTLEPTHGPHFDPRPVPALTLERALGRVRKPGRYAGGEWNSAPRDWSAVALKWCLAYPDLYEIGMSNLGLRILYEVVNERPDRLAERCFAPDVDLQAQLCAAGLPLWSLETRRSLADFDVLGVSLGYELAYTNLLDILELGGLPILAQDRSDADALVIAGGSCALNPEPLADFLDAVVLGEGEDVVLEISDALERIGWPRRPSPAGEWRRGVPRREALVALAGIPGVYVPSLYRPHYRPDGAFERLERLDEAAPSQITARIAADFETVVRGIRQIVPNVEIVFDRAQLEVMRGCTRGCRFCQAGMSYRPVREREPETAVAAATAILRATGFEEIGLTSLSTADYTYVNEVAAATRRRHPGVAISLPSTRVDAFTVELIDAISGTGRRGGFTFAPEAGSQRLRDAINKGVSDEEITSCAELAFEHGWSALKLYFMIGLPGETMEDVLAIAAICERVLEVGRRYHGGSASVKASVSTFVPKVATPFMWAGQDTGAEIEAKVGVLRKAVHGRGLDLRWTDPRASLLEASLGRGDRRLGAVVAAAWRNGARFDAWDEHFDFDAWQAAFAASGLDPAWYAQRDIPLDEPLPWQHLACGVSADFLIRESRRAEAAKTTADCRWGPCYKCGVPEATGYRCQTGEQGPRVLRASPPAGGGADPEVDGRPGAGSQAAESRSGHQVRLGVGVQSKNAGLSGLASPVEAAGGETGG